MLLGHSQVLQVTSHGPFNVHLLWGRRLGAWNLDGLQGQTERNQDPLPANTVAHFPPMRHHLHHAGHHYEEIDRSRGGVISGLLEEEDSRGEMESRSTQVAW